MANPANETVIYPFTAFNFAVEIEVPDLSPEVCSAAFAECDGLEMTMDVKTIREGGNNTQQVRLTGAVFFRVEARAPWVIDGPDTTLLSSLTPPPAQHVIS